MPENTQIQPVIIQASFQAARAASLIPTGAGLVYIDPPFNTGQVRRRVPAGTLEYDDVFTAEQYEALIREAAQTAYDALRNDGSFFLHLDPRDVHYAKIICDQVFGRDAFINEIIWAYDYGARSKSRWPAKHDNILWYAKDPRQYVFNFAAIDRIPYMAPGLVGPEKAARGKTPTDVWWQTIVSPTGHEKTGYPTQKPIKLLNRIVKTHTNPGDVVIDFFGGSGTTAAAAISNNRRAVYVDSNPQAVDIAVRRLKALGAHPEVITLPHA